MQYQFLAEVLMLLLAAVAILYLFRRLRPPPVLSYLVVGILTGPTGLGLGVSIVVGRTLAELRLGESGIMVNAIRRNGITGREPLPDTMLREGDVLVLFGTPEALEHGESLLLDG